MGSLTSRPQLPQVQQPVYIMAPSAPPPAASSPSPAAPPPTGIGAATEPPPTEEAQRRAREESLLQRSRGRLSTVLTGFSGILSQTVAQGARKTLLGE